MNHSQQLPIDPMTRQPQRIPGPLGSHCEYQLKQKLEIELEKKEIALDICQFILDMTGIIDPTPASDGTNAIISLSRGRWIDAVISVVSIVPYVGDFAKLGKLPRYLKSIKKAIRIARTDFHWSNALKRLFIPLKKVIDQLYELGANKLPPHANKTLSQIKREIDHFLKPASSGTTANQTVGEFIANSSKNSSPKVKQSGNTPSKSKQTNIEEKPKKGVSSEKESGIIDGKVVENVDAAKNTKQALGGRHRDTKIDGNKNGTQSHHPIADDVSDIATNDAPAIRMETDDHVYRTGNWGSRKSSKRFRAKQKELIEQGKHDEAYKMGVDDIKDQNPGKYDTHIEQMENSFPKKPDGSIDWSKFKKK
ncbi:MAG: hypothetical protein L3J75_12420 [Methylococcaceae bacterium]|nr:hypothetical protein [Methylococcaceae bacterium]